MSTSPFHHIEQAPPDPIIGLTEAFNNDTNPAKEEQEDKRPGDPEADARPSAPTIRGAFKRSNSVEPRSR